LTFALSVLSGYTCPGSMILEPTMYFDGTVATVPAGIFSISSDYVTATFTSVFYQEITPQVLSFQVDVTDTAEDLSIVTTYA